jgi:putative ABC transport system substrate-binding protein
MNAIARRDFVLALAGTAVAWPLAARAQQSGKIPTVGYLWHAGSPDEETPYFGALREGFARLGYVERRNLKLEHRFPNEMPERFKSMAAELVALNVDVLRQRHSAGQARSHRSIPPVWCRIGVARLSSQSSPST